MEKSKSRGDEPPTPQEWDSDSSSQSSPKSYAKSQLPQSPAPTNVLTVSPRVGATEDRDVLVDSERTNASDASIDKTKIAQAALSYSPKTQQPFTMESVKALLKNFLNDVKEEDPNHSSYLEGLLTQWLEISRRDQAHKLLIYVLGDHIGQYDNRTLDIQNLDPVDRTKTSLLDQQGSQRGVCIHLAKMTSAINNIPNDPLGLAMAIRLHEVRDLKGEILNIKPTAVEPEIILQKSMLEERYHQPSAVENSYPSPTEGALSVEIGTAKSFQDWVLVIMPETHRFRFLTVNADPQALHEWIEAQAADLQPAEIFMADEDPNVRWGLKLACKTQLSNVAEWLASAFSQRTAEDCSRQSEMLGAVVCASCKLRSPELFNPAMILKPGMMSLTAWERIGSSIDLRRFPLYEDSLDQALGMIPSFQARYLILKCIHEGSGAQSESQEILKVIHEWIQDQFEGALKEVQLVEKNDGAIAVLVAKTYVPVIAMSDIVAFAKKHSWNHPFAFEFAFSLYDELVAGIMDSGAVRYALTEILLSAVPALCSGGAQSWNVQQGLPTSAWFDPSYSDQSKAQADSMARLIRCCLTVGLQNEEHALLQYLWLGTSLADAQTLQHVFLPYLRNLLGVMQDYHIPLTTQSYQWQFQNVLSLFIFHYIGREPPPPFPDFTYPPLGCASPENPYGCSTCLALDSFLVDPNLRTADLTGVPDHVAGRIQGVNDLQMTVTSQSSEDMTCVIQIIKNTKFEEFDERHDAWRARVVKANDMIQAVCGDDEWKVLLGDRYDECMGLDMVRKGLEDRFHQGQ